MSEVITKTVINQNTVMSPLLVANEAQIDKLNLSNIDNLQAKSAYIDNLTIKELVILEEEGGNSDSSETYEPSLFNKVTLNFRDEDNCKYTTANHETLTSDGEAMILEIEANVPAELGTKLVCRYLVLDLRELDTTVPVGVAWPDINIKWLYGLPDIEAGYFYVIAFQRFTKNLFIGNVAIKIEGDNI